MAFAREERWDADDPTPWVRARVSIVLWEQAVDAALIDYEALVRRLAEIYQDLSTGQPGGLAGRAGAHRHRLPPRACMVMAARLSVSWSIRYGVGVAVSSTVCEPGATPV